MAIIFEKLSLSICHSYSYYVTKYQIVGTLLVCTEFRLTGRRARMAPSHTRPGFVFRCVNGSHRVLIGHITCAPYIPEIFSKNRGYTTYAVKRFAEQMRSSYFFCSGWSRTGSGSPPKEILYNKRSGYFRNCTLVLQMRKTFSVYMYILYCFPLPKD